MSLSDGVLPSLILMAVLASSSAWSQQGVIGCPGTHHGRPLERVGLFLGHPSDHGELMPKPGRFVVPKPSVGWSGPRSEYALGCFYRGSREVVAVFLPLHISECTFNSWPHVECR